MGSAEPSFASRAAHASHFHIFRQTGSVGTSRPRPRSVLTPACPMDQVDSARLDFLLCDARRRGPGVFFAASLGTRRISSGDAAEQARRTETACAVIVCLLRRAQQPGTPRYASRFRPDLPDPGRLFARLPLAAAAE